MDNKTEEAMMTSTLAVSVPSFTEKYIEKNTITFYNVEVYNNYSKQKWLLEKRYSEFESLFKALGKIVPNVPQMPGKTIFKVTSYDGLTKRRVQLEKFLRECVLRKDIVSNETFKDFLELEKHSPELSYNSPTKISELADMPLGVRDFIYLKYENIIFMANSDMNIASRVDAYITNVNLPWEKKTDAHISVGAAFAYKVIIDSNNEYSFDKLWAKSYPVQTGIINWDSESSTLSVGLDNGKIYFYKVSPDSNFMQYEELCELKPHTGRVMGIAFDFKTGYIYSCSSDKKFIVSEINFQESITEVTIGSHGFTNLVCDKKNERLFLSNEVGVVFVYSYSTYPPTLLNTIQTSSKESLRGIHVDYRKFYIFTASQQGKICVLELGHPGKERFIKEVTTFGGNTKLRIVRYNSQSNEIITGDQNGRVTIWSLRTGQPIYAFEAHKSAITQIYFDEDTKIIVTGSKDRTIKFWKLPDKWCNEEITKFEQNEIKNISDSIAMLKLQRSLVKNDDDDSEDDDLNGWDFR